MPISPVAGIESRIAAIKARFDADQQSSTVGSNAFTDGSALLESAQPSTEGFEPFGAAYQLALQQVRVSAMSNASVGLSDENAFSVNENAFVATGQPGASIGKIGGYGPMPVPSELAAYGNGQIPAAALQPIGQGGHRLYAPAAQAWQQAVADAKAEGIDLRITDSYRGYDEQVDLAARKGLYAEGGYAAVPGTSNHGWGLAVDADVNAPETLSWLKANAWKYGFVESVPREPWHWEYRPAQA
jgi:hypothetical protein